jgi:hypothetical protein
MTIPGIDLLTLMSVPKRLTLNSISEDSNPTQELTLVHGSMQLVIC